MLDKNGFDLWADGYEKTVDMSDEENTYPFAGYRDVLGRIFQIIVQKPNAKVLDVGFGTGTLSTKLHERGCSISGQDFSSRMIELARAKMPDADLYQGDFRHGLVEPLRNQTYDFIVATYSLHHLTDEQKVILMHSFYNCLNENGKILIGDIAFESREKMDLCRREAGDEWDDEECYFVADELKNEFPGLAFIQVSHCAGILMLAR